MDGTLIFSSGKAGKKFSVVANGGLFQIPNQAVFYTWDYNPANAVPANSADQALPILGSVTARAPGQLNFSDTFSILSLPIGSTLEFRIPVQK